METPHEGDEADLQSHEDVKSSVGVQREGSFVVGSQNVMMSSPRRRRRRKSGPRRRLDAHAARQRKRELKVRQEARRHRLLNTDFKAIAEAARLAYKPREEQKKKIQRLWMPLMILASRTHRFTKVLQFYRENRVHIKRVKRATIIIQRWFRGIHNRRKEASQRAREQQYGWMVLRKMKSIHFRKMAERKNQAAEILKMLLVFERRKLSKGVKTFRYKVLKIQSFWKHRMAMFGAACEVLQRQWVKVEMKILDAYREDELKKELTRRIKLHAKNEKRKMTGKEMEAARVQIRDNFVDPRIHEYAHTHMLHTLENSIKHTHTHTTHTLTLTHTHTLTLII